MLDDDREWSEHLSELLCAEDYFVILTPHGKSAEEYLRVGPAPQLIITDTAMPEMDGMEFARRVRQDPRLANVPRVLVSHSADDEAVRYLIQPAVAIRKPTYALRVLEAVDAQLRQPNP